MIKPSSRACVSNKSRDVGMWRVKVRLEKGNSLGAWRLFPFLPKPDVFWFRVGTWRWRGNWKQRQIAARLWDKLKPRRCNMIFLRSPWASGFFYFLLFLFTFLTFFCFYSSTSSLRSQLNLFHPLFLERIAFDWARWLWERSDRGSHLIRVYCVYMWLTLFCVCFRRRAKSNRSLSLASALEPHLLWAPIVWKQILSTFLPFSRQCILIPQSDSGLVSQSFRDGFRGFVSTIREMKRMKCTCLKSRFGLWTMVNKSAIIVGSWDFCRCGLVDKIAEF